MAEEKNDGYTIEHINRALVESKRPKFYGAMKYWGKKPPNIWRHYIETYTPKNGVFLDPFSGSGISAFEAFKANRKAIAFDLNPLTSFLIEVKSSKFDEKKFGNRVVEIMSKVYKDETYEYYFSTQCPNCNNNEAIAQSFKWESGSIYEIGVECTICGNNETGRSGKKKHKTCGSVYRSLKKPNKEDINKAENMVEINNYWFPDKPFPDSPSFSAGFIEAIGGNSFSKLWTKRNLYVLSKIFHLILEENNTTIKKQLLFGFIQTVHLCTKMSVPRRPKANRPFSTSWGRSAYLCSNRQMEMNPLFVFESSCFKRQSVTNALSNAKVYLGNRPKLKYVHESNKSDRSKNYDIKYGPVNINNIDDYVDEESVDFIMTDPPYGGLVQYFDLSSIWLVWLEKFDGRYKVNYDSEITIKDGSQTHTLDTYSRRFLGGMRKLYKLLKPKGHIVFTFHNKDLKIWNTFLKSLNLAGFKVEKVIHQQNKRTGESNVANPYGTSAADFYIRCIKKKSILNSDIDDFEHFVLTKAIEIIGQRNEPTPYQIVFNGLLPEISEAGFDLKDYDKSLQEILSKHVGDIFKIEENSDNGAGKYWWFVEPEKHIKYPDKKLSERVEESIISLLRRKVSVDFDEVLANIFTRYPNGLTPYVNSIKNILESYAIKSGGKWVYKGNQLEVEFTEHSATIYQLTSLGKKLGFKTFTGKREQPDKYEGKRLSKYANYTSLNKVLRDYSKARLKRIEMIDHLWIADGKVTFIFEVENSTKFTQAIQRGSNIKDDNVVKVIVLPRKRKNEFLSIEDPLFIKNFNEYNWKYLFYDELKKICKKQNPTTETLKLFLKGYKK
jgi:DNA modification methylase/Zn ribbon nucleic-acid-binding protein